MRSRVFFPPVEVFITLAMALLMTILSLAYGLPVRLPQGTSATAFVLQAALPLVCIVGWLIWHKGKGRTIDIGAPLISVACYAAIIIIHFNLKLWVPFLRAGTCDPLLWRVDYALHPLIDASMAARAMLSPVIRYDAGFYLAGLVAMFYLSFGYHALRTPHMVRRLFLAVFLVQVFGALAYCVTPAIGPFLYEHGVNLFTTAAQNGMLEAREQALATGPGWLSTHGGVALFAGLGAMPSLHAASAFLFLYFACLYGRVLLPTYVPLFGFIIINAIASRWHYLLDIPAGIALAWMSVAVAKRLDTGGRRRHALRAYLQPLKSSMPKVSPASLPSSAS